MQEIIYEHLKKYNLKEGLKGFKYIIRAIEISIAERENIQFGILDLYERIADEYKDTKSAVERVIRTCIRSNGLSIKNKDFIGKVVNEILLGNEEQPISNIEIETLLIQVASDIKALRRELSDIMEIELKVNKILEILEVNNNEKT